MTLATFTSSASLIDLGAQADALPSRIELMPIGNIDLQDERGVVGAVTDAQALIARSMAAAKGGILPIDFDHGLDNEERGDRRAAGWITALDVQGDRIMATVEWTTDGAASLKGRMFRFISPTFTAPKEGGEVGLILRAGLTNNPALPELAKVASQQETPTMPKWLKQLAAKLGMPEETDEAKILAAAETKIDEANRAEPIVTAAGLTGALTETAATAIEAKLKTGAASVEPDPTKFVPMATFEATSQKLARLQETVGTNEVAVAIQKATADGKLAPAMNGWAEEYAKKDLDGFKTWAASAPVLVDGERKTPEGDPTPSPITLSEAERQVIAATGVTEEAFLATKQGKKPDPKKKDA